MRLMKYRILVTTDSYEKDYETDNSHSKFVIVR